jgi:hypothetical protein
MKTTPAASAPTPRRWPRLRRWAAKATQLVVAGLLLGWLYSWAVPRFYHEEVPAGFWLGTLHGGLMPAALPSLLLGDNVPIFAANNNGRKYKLGYITGINLCGFIFFGLAFRKNPRAGAEP